VTSISQDSTTSALQLLNANNSAFAGNYNINAGTLQLAGTNTTGTITATNASSAINLGATSGTSAATLNFVNNAVSGKVNNNINVRAGSSGTKSMTTNASVSFATTGTITLDDNLTVNPNSAGFGFTFNGLIQDGTSGPKGLLKAGAGNATLTLAETYSGATSVTAGNLILSGSAGALPNTSGITITGGSVQLNNTGAANNGDRIPDTTTVTIVGGTVDLKNDATAATNFSETIALTASVAGTITASQAAIGGSSALTIGSFTRNPGATLAFTGTGLGLDTRNQILFTTAPATINGIIPWATYGTTGFANYDGTNGIVAAAATDIDAQGSTIANDSTSNLRIFADGTGSAIALGAATTSINSLVQANTVVAPATIDTAGKTLRVNSVLLSSAANTKGLTIGSAEDDGTLTTGTDGGELLLINNSASALTVNSVIANNTTASSLTKAGTGDATFAGNNTYTGATYLAGGVVTAADDNAFGSGTININNPTKRLAVANGVTLSNPITFNGGGEGSRGVFENGGAGGNATIAGPITISGTLAGGGHFASNGTGGTLTISGPITSTGTSPVVRTGTVIFSGDGNDSSYSTFNAAAGITRLGASDALLPTATLDLGTSGESRFDLNGFNQTLAGINRTPNNNTFIGNSSTTADSILTTTGTSTYSGSLLNVLSPGTMKTFLVVDSGSLTLSGAFSAQNATINNGGTLNINTSGGDSFNPAGRLITVNNGGVLKYLAANKVQNDTVIDVKLGGTFDENGQADTIGHITGAGSITNLNSSLTLSLPAVGSPAEFSGTISGASTTGSALVLSANGTGASAASTLILSGNNSGMTATSGFSSVNVQGGRLIGRNSAAFGPAGQIISVGAGALTLDPTIEFANNTALNAYVINVGSGNTGTIELNRATSGAALTQPASTPTLGNGTLNIEKGANVTSGTPTLEFPALSLTAGGGGLGAATLNPVDVNISVLGGVTRPGTSASNLKLDGTSTGNSIAGDIQDNGANKLNVIKSNTGTWTLGGLNSYTGTTALNGGTLHLTGSLAAGSAVTVGGAAASGTPTLTGAGGTVNGTLNIAAAGGGAAGTVNPGTVGTTGTLNAGATTIAGTFACDVNGASTDQLVVTGDLTLGGTLSINEVAAGTPGTYVIASYTGTRSGTLGGTLPAGYSVNYDDANKEVELVIAPASGFASWITGFGLAGGDQDPTDDPDSDGVDNLTEFALNGNPNNGSNNGLTALVLQDTNASTTNELTLVAAVRDGAVFAPAGTTQTATIDGVVYTIEGSLDLVFPGSAVSTVGSAIETTPAGTTLPDITGSDWEYRTFRLDASEGLPGKGFLRAKITAAP
jgi:autotransporter-associated beta strand protein